MKSDPLASLRKAARDAEVIGNLETGEKLGDAFSKAAILNLILRRAESGNPLPPGEPPTASMVVDASTDLLFGAAFALLRLSGPEIYSLPEHRATAAQLFEEALKAYAEAYK